MLYKIVYRCVSDYYIEKALKEFEKKVNDLCKKGWMPQGGVVIVDTHGNGYDICQAMVKQDE